MFDISKIRQKSVLGCVKAQKFSQVSANAESVLHRNQQVVDTRCNIAGHHEGPTELAPAPNLCASSDTRGSSGKLTAANVMIW